MSPIPYLVERKSLHHHPLVRVLADGKRSLGLQEIMDLLIVHLRRKDKKERTPTECRLDWAELLDREARNWGVFEAPDMRHFAG